MTGRLALLSICLAVPLSTAAAQNEQMDQGILIVRIGDVEAGREHFTLTSGRRGGIGGSTLSIATSYPVARPTSRYTTVLERGVGQTLAAFQVELAGPAPERTIAELSRGRLTVRVAAPGRESAREYPGGPQLVILDDSVFSLWMAIADLATEEGVTLRAVAPRTGWRGEITATRVRRPDAPPIIMVRGGVEAELRLDADGRFAGLLLPSRGVEVLRVPDQPSP
jgi:hypothetical protein